LSGASTTRPQHGVGTRSTTARPRAKSFGCSLSIAILTAALAQRFVAVGVSEEVEEFEADVATEIESAEVEMLAEVRFIRERLGRPEARLGGRVL
jgi:hypothetical protein